MGGVASGVPTRRKTLWIDHIRLFLSVRKRDNNLIDLRSVSYTPIFDCRSYACDHHPPPPIARSAHLQHRLRGCPLTTSPITLPSNPPSPSSPFQDEINISNEKSRIQQLTQRVIYCETYGAVSVRLGLPLILNSRVVRKVEGLTFEEFGNRHGDCGGKVVAPPTSLGRMFNVQLLPRFSTPTISPWH